eukprot:scaffold1328_cov161-Pinguiococcus_pyrenoidosus.AAC.4
MGIVYLPQPAELVRTSHFKIDRSSLDDFTRLTQGYRKGRRDLITFHCPYLEPSELEQILKDTFRSRFYSLSRKCRRLDCSGSTAASTRGSTSLGFLVHNHIAEICALVLLGILNHRPQNLDDGFHTFRVCPLGVFKVLAKPIQHLASSRTVVVKMIPCSRAFLWNSILPMRMMPTL